MGVQSEIILNVFYLIMRLKTEQNEKEEKGYLNMNDAVSKLGTEICNCKPIIKLFPKINTHDLEPVSIYVVKVVKR